MMSHIPLKNSFEDRIEAVFQISPDFEMTNENRSFGLHFKTFFPVRFFFFFLNMVVFSVLVHSVIFITKFLLAKTKQETKTSIKGVPWRAPRHQRVGKVTSGYKKQSNK